MHRAKLRSCSHGHRCFRICKNISVVTVQRRFRAQFNKEPPVYNSIRKLYETFRNEGCLCINHRPGRPGPSQETVDRVIEAYEPSPQKSFKHGSIELASHKQCVANSPQETKVYTLQASSRRWWQTSPYQLLYWNAGKFWSWRFHKQAHIFRRSYISRFNKMAVQLIFIMTYKTISTQRWIGRFGQ